MVPKQLPIAYIVDSLSLVLRLRPRFYPVFGSEWTQVGPKFSCCEFTQIAFGKADLSVIEITRQLLKRGYTLRKHERGSGKSRREGYFAWISRMSLPSRRQIESAGAPRANMPSVGVGAVSDVVGASMLLLSGPSVWPAIVSCSPMDTCVSIPITGF